MLHCLAVSYLYPNENIEKFRGGDELVFENIVKATITLVFSYSLRLLRDKADAADAAQDVYLKLFKGRNSFDVSKDFNTWLLSITRNVCLDIIRKKRNVNFSSLDEVDELFSDSIVDLSLPTQDESYASGEEKLQLTKMIDRLSLAESEVILLHYFGEFSFEEIARATDRPAATVRSLHLRALNRLRTLVR